jgi:hypothetical protein
MSARFFALTLSLILSLIASNANAVCTKATIKGPYGGSATMSYYSDGFVSMVVGAVRFDGAGKITVTKIVEGVAGDRYILKGSGTYSLASNCTGTANLTVKQNGSIIGKATLDMVVAGTPSAPTIFALYTNQASDLSGNLVLTKIKI